VGVLSNFGGVWVVAEPGWSLTRDLGYPFTGRASQYSTCGLARLHRPIYKHSLINDGPELVSPHRLPFHSHVCIRMADSFLQATIIFPTCTAQRRDCCLVAVCFLSIWTALFIWHRSETECIRHSHNSVGAYI
jgi:hypothetical protein